MVADGFKKPNGVALSPDGKVLYVSDTGRETGNGAEQDLPHTIYAFDIVSPPTKNAASKPGSFMWLQNRRVFACVGASPPAARTHMDGYVGVDASSSDQPCGAERESCSFAKCLQRSTLCNSLSNLQTH